MAAARIAGRGLRHKRAACAPRQEAESATQKFSPRIGPPPRQEARAYSAAPADATRPLLTFRGLSAVKPSTRQSVASPAAGRNRD